MKIKIMTANEKKLYVLEKLKEEWDLTPKKDKAKYKESSFNYITYYKHPRETTISYQKQLSIPNFTEPIFGNLFGKVFNKI